MTEPSGPEVVYRSTPEEYAKGQWASLADHALIERALDGQELGFELLMERYTALVTGYFYHRVNNAADAEDLAQEVFLMAYRQLAHLRQRSLFRSWLMHIAHNKLVDYYRTNSRRPQLVGSGGLGGWDGAEGHSDDPSAGDILARVAAPGLDSGRQAHLAQTRSIILREIERLGEKYATVLTLRLIEEQSTEEIANHLGLSVMGVRVRIFRGLKKLRRALTKLGVGEM